MNAVARPTITATWAIRTSTSPASSVLRGRPEDKYCIDILTQISAMKSALENLALGLMDDHLKHCVLDAARAGGDEGAAKIAEASAAIQRLVKS